MCTFTDDLLYPWAVGWFLEPRDADMDARCPVLFEGAGPSELAFLKSS